MREKATRTWTDRGPPLEVLTDRDSGTYSILLRDKYDAPCEVVIEFSKSELVDVVERASHLEAQGLRDKNETNRPIKEVFKEREVITREIVKVRCRNCGTPFEEKLNRCPHCGAPP